MSTSWRMFCAFELPESLRTQIHEHTKRVREAVPEAAASWSRPENIHLTVKFFGSVDPVNISLISAAAERVAKEFSPVQIQVGTTGLFPRPSRPQVLWVGVADPSNRLLALQQRLEDEFEREGFPKEDRPFRPHLTVARVRNPQGTRRLAQTHLETEFAQIAVTLDELVLFRSETSSKGSKYTPISTHRLEH